MTTLAEQTEQTEQTVVIRAAGAGTGGPIGRRVPRREDARLLTGHGRYLDDHYVPGLCHVAIARSPWPHADIAAVDVSAALALEGVVAVVTQDDLDAAGARPMRHLLAMPGVKPLTWGVLASGRVRFVGEPVAAVVATSRAVAEDAVELIDIDYRERPAVIGAAAALAPDAPLLYSEWGTNEFLHLEQSSAGAEAALAGAPHVLTERFESHRIIGLPLEGHGAQAAWDPAGARLTVYASNQQPHQLRTVIAEVCGLEETAVRVISPDMGGGFGNKQHFTREECLVALLARITGRPVRWSQDRVESLVASVHSRPQVHDVEAGYDDDGRILALRVKVTSDIGNPVLYFSGVAPSLVTVASLAGGYALPELAWSLSCVATTTCPVGAYRGFGQPQAHLSTERIMDLVAADLGLDPVTVRRRNLLPDAPRPWYGHSGQRLDVGCLGPHLDHLLDFFGYDGWRNRQAAARAAGRLVGIGLSTLVQGTAPSQHGAAGRFGSFEMATVTLLPDGTVRVVCGTKSQGQGHETVWAQIAAGVLGVPVERVSVGDGDTDALVFGMGTWGSRSAVMGGGAVQRAAEAVRAKLEAIAAFAGRRLAPADGAVDETAAPAGGADGGWSAGPAGGVDETAAPAGGYGGGSAGPAGGVDETAAPAGGYGGGSAGPARGAEGGWAPLSELAALAWWHPHRLPPGMEPGLTATVAYSPGHTVPEPDADGRTNFEETYATAMAAIAVEVDPMTGAVEILDAAAVCDFGVVINPMIVEGQLQGAFAQGVGNVFLEEVRYSEEGQPLCSTLLDYTIPTAPDVPVLRIDHRPTPAATAGGFRGMGEAGIIATPAMIVGAVDDALRPLGVRLRSTRLHPASIRAAIRRTGWRPDVAAWAAAPGR